MQKDIQPKYEAIEVRCACGNTFKAGSVKDAILSILESKRI